MSQERHKADTPLWRAIDKYVDVCEKEAYDKGWLHGAIVTFTIFALTYFIIEWLLK